MSFKIVGTILLVFQSLIVLSQGIGLKKSDQAFENMQYPQAVRGYLDVLESKSVSGSQRQQTLTNLAFSFKKLQDFKNAENVYRDLFKEFEDKLSPVEYLNFAQVLAANSKYRDSQKMYSKYSELQKQDLRGGKFALAYMDNSHFFKDSALYKIQYMDKLNTKYSDFAPMYYETGLVFVAARNEGTIIKRIFNQNETPFLDLYLFADTSMTFIPKNEDDEMEIELPLAELGNSGANVKKIKRKTKDIFGEEIEVEEFSKSLNTKYHEGPVTFNKDFTKIVFTRNNYSKGKAKKSDKGINMLKLYMAEKKGNKWTNIQELPFNSNNYSTGHPAFSPENLRLYFVSDMPGGFGGTDLYMVDYINGNWGTPVNLGSEVNTEGNEMFPFADQYGNLYFASDGHAGLGGLDVFYVEMRNGIPHSKVENLGYPINSEKDDFALITDGNRSSGYFSSNRKRGYSDDNIYSFVKGCNALELKIFDNSTKKPIANAELRLIKNEVNKDEFSSNENGVAKVCLEAGTDFYFKVFKDGYESATVTYGTLSGSLSKKQIISVYLEPTTLPLVRGKVVSEFDNSPIVGATVTLENLEDGSTETVITGLDGKYTFQPLKKGEYAVKTVKENSIASQKTLNTEKPTLSGDISMLTLDDQIELKNIYYDYGKYAIKPSGKKELIELVVPLMKQYENLIIELKSHTDSHSSKEFNLELSQKRADEVKRFLMSFGIESNRILAKGYGETQLLNECEDNVPCSDALHRQNRRTEIKILDISEIKDK